MCKLNLHCACLSFLLANFFFNTELYYLCLLISVASLIVVKADGFVNHH